ncbi:MAG: hypothetical protein PHQ12_01910 [Chthoniobacteraceae bacterium]|nr:hypothetical protein [Chthoniobacteraceae bacterium]
MSKSPFMAGVAADISALTGREKELMRDAGIQWLRTGNLGFDPQAFLRGEKQPGKFLAAKQRMAALRREGFRFTGITPGPLKMPETAGAPGSSAYLDNYRRICAFLGEEYRELVDYWQVANELDIWIFRHTLTLEQSVDFLKAGIRGVKETNAKSKVGINITLFPSRPGKVDGNTEAHEGVFIAKGIYQDSGLELDYAGFDSYPGTWREGGAESWNEYLDAFYALTGKPIIIQEFGYSSAGEMMTPEENRSGIYPCKAKKWRFSWNGKGHTPEAQAEFIEASYRIFAQKPHVLGATYFRWTDPEKCWQCGQADCPVETAWGLLDRAKKPKPSYYSYQAVLRDILGNRK